MTELEPPPAAPERPFVPPARLAFRNHHRLRPTGRCSRSRPSNRAQLPDKLPPAPGVVPVAPVSILPPRSMSTLPATRSTMGWLPWSLRTWPLLTVSPLRRTTMTAGPPELVCVTALVKSGAPSAQLVLEMVPALESMVVVPAALQFQVGDMMKFAAHCVTSRLIEGGSSIGVHALPSTSAALPASAPPPASALALESEASPALASRRLTSSNTIDTVSSTPSAEASALVGLASGAPSDAAPSAAAQLPVHWPCVY